MKLVSWNCRGLGGREKKEAIGKIIRVEKPQILLIQETKMRDFESFRKLIKFGEKVKE
jgi:exonuclease III